MTISAAVWTGIAAVTAGAVGIGAGVAATQSDDAAPSEAITVEVSVAEPATAEPAALVATSGAAPAYTVFDCPGGRPAGALAGGDRVVATGTDESGGWVELRRPTDFDDRVWITSTAVVPDTDFDDLTVSDCDEPVVIEVTAPTETTEAPTESTEVPVATVEDDTDDTDDTTTIPTTAAPAPGTPTPPTTTPNGPRPPTPPKPPTPPVAPTTAPPTTRPTTTPPTTQPPTTPPPDTTGPSISVGANPNTIWETFPGLCTDKPRQTTVSGSISDPSGIASVTASASFGSTSGVSGSTSFSLTFSSTQGASGIAQITITATDKAGNSSSKSTAVTVNSAASCFG